MSHFDGVVERGVVVCRVGGFAESSGESAFVGFPLYSSF